MNDRERAAADVKTARAAQTKAMADRDFEAAASLWTEDVTMRRALGQAIAGRSEYLDMLSSTSSGQNPIVYQRTAVTVDVSDRWPLAYEEGRWSGHVGNADGQPVIAGRYAAQWVKRDERWLIRSEVFVALTCEGGGCLFEALP
ncbi:nuclear transport factor 2 family protein [Bradyrhizobium sp. LTSPM299]|uniref:YybH family protein n=1 Tax=Bradyrhizobium sp. LTSPM299 TaxID=1619233 RepID=UPI000679D9FC|nr:nuclear transport factor 2 family protein [Bradyrhizobium sp. LTSPM299]